MLLSRGIQVKAILFLLIFRWSVLILELLKHSWGFGDPDVPHDVQLILV